MAELQTKSGRGLHPIGIGTWGYGEYPFGSPGWTSEIEAVRYAVQLGQNHIDTAEMYSSGQSEKLVGKAIGSLRREDLFVASKLWKNHVTKDTVRPAVEAMLQRLGTDYLDMLYIHAPWFDVPWWEAVSQIDDLIDEGVVRYFGVSNFKLDHIKRAAEISRHPVAAEQVHFSCLHQQEASVELRDFCAANDIAVVAYMPLEKGYVGQYPLVWQIAAARGATPEQVALAWLLSKNALPIPKTGRKNHLEQNIAARELKLSPEEIARIDSLQTA